MIRYVIRPATIRRTPTLLAGELDATTRRYPGNGPFDWSRDFFMVFPHPSSVTELRPSTRSVYESLWRFGRANKASQRELLAGAGLPVPETYQSSAEAITAQPGHWIARPLRHSGGLGYRRTEDVSDFTEGAEYIQRVYPKDREYRLIYVYGTHLITLRKKVPEGLGNDQPWNHSAGAFFQTINHWENCRLASTNILACLNAVPIITSAHIVAIDVMWSERLGYSICELNTCPGLTIENNLRKVAEHAEHHRLVSSTVEL